MKLRHLVLVSVVSSLTTLGVEAALSTPEGQKITFAAIGNVREQIARISLGAASQERTPLEIALAQDDGAEIALQEVFNAPSPTKQPKRSSEGPQIVTPLDLTAVPSESVGPVDSASAQGNTEPMAERTSHDASEIIGADDLLTPKLKHTLENGLSNQDWHFSSDGFFKKGVKPVIPTPDETSILWPIQQAVHDEKGDRVFGLSSNVYARVYRGDLKTGAFAQLTKMRGPDFNGAIWSPDREQLVITGMDSFGGDDPVVIFIDPETGQELIMPLRAEKFAGLDDLLLPKAGSRPSIVPIAIDGDLLVVAARPGRLKISRLEDRGNDPTWLIDLGTKEVRSLSNPSQSSLK